ncbi:MAG: hypothetical protein LBU34_05015 [Planctomycetaceae bacterium]|nr:hypothetical protein [Planctomycetaceae bacterium]
MSPFRDPFNYNNDPLVFIGIDLVGSAIHHRYLAEGKPGAVMRNTASYSTWFNGGDRTTTGFHNQIGLLLEIIGNPTPISIPLISSKLLPGGDQPFPIGPKQEWHFRQSIDYIITSERAILDLAAKLREDFLFRIYQAGKNSIERGSQDYWTLTPKRVAILEAEYTKYLEGQRRKDSNYQPPVDARGRSRGIPYEFWEKLRTPETREPQDHPNDFQYPGGPPKPPYDVAGYTLAFQMGVQFDRILDGFDGPFEKISGLLKPPVGKISGAENPAGYLLSHRVNDSFVGTTRLLEAGEDVYWLASPLNVNNKTYPVGTIYIPAKSSTRSVLQKLTEEPGLSFDALATEAKPQGNAFKLRPVRVGLWDRYGGSMDSGWIRWLFEQAFPFPSFNVVYVSELDAGNLKSKYDVLILPPGATPQGDFRQGSVSRNIGETASVTPQPSQTLQTPQDEPRQRSDSDRVPDEYKNRVGNITKDKTVPQLRQFVEEGGILITIGSSTGLAQHLDLPVVDALAENTPDGKGKRFSSDKFYIPGSVLRTNEANLGKGKVFLFGSEITFRGQPHASFNFLFNSIYYAGATFTELP